MSLIFLPKSLRVFFLLFSSDPKWTLSPLFSYLSPINLHLLSHSPSLRFEAVIVALHLRSKTLADPSISDPKPSPHPPSTISPSPSISYLTLNPCLTLHLRSPPSPSTSTTTTASRPILGFGFCFETHLRLWLLLQDPSCLVNSLGTPKDTVELRDKLWVFFIKLVWLYGCFFFKKKILIKNFWVFVSVEYTIQV